MFYLTPPHTVTHIVTLTVSNMVILMVNNTLTMATLIIYLTHYEFPVYSRCPNSNLQNHSQTFCHSQSLIGQNTFVFKVYFVYTLILCLKMPDTKQKTRI